jgi:hypothetical protein
MAWPWLALIAKNVPWVELARRAPTILARSRDLLDESRRARTRETPRAHPSLDELRDRVEVLEQRDAEHARLLADMVEQLEGLTEAVRVLSVRGRLLAVIGVVVLLALAAAVVSIASANA